jgi:hypothetical protein
MTYFPVCVWRLGFFLPFLAIRMGLSGASTTKARLQPGTAGAAQVAGTVGQKETNLAPFLVLL